MGRTDPRLVDRLVDSDPALRRQGERDVVHEPEVVWAATRARRHRGLRCAAGGAPGSRGAVGGRSVLPERRHRGRTRRAAGARTALDGHHLDAERAAGVIDGCMNASTVANGLWLGADVEGIVAWFVEHQLVDGGWSCEWVQGSTRSSFASTGELVRPWAVWFAYPFRWASSVLGVIDLLRRAALVDDTTTRRPTPARPRRSSSFVLLGSRAGCGSRWTWERASRRRGSPPTPCACWVGGTRPCWTRAVSRAARSRQTWSAGPSC